MLVTYTRLSCELMKGDRATGQWQLYTEAHLQCQARHDFLPIYLGRNQSSAYSIRPKGFSRFFLAHQQSGFLATRAHSLVADIKCSAHYWVA